MRRQLSLFSRRYPPGEYGGELVRGRRKIARPFHRRLAIHATFRAAAARAGSRWSMHHRRHKGEIYLLAYREAERCGIRIERFVNVGNHLHLLFKTRERASMQRFLRSFAGQIARLVTTARKARPRGKFWTYPVHTRLVAGGRDWENILRYFRKNLWDAEGPDATLILPNAIVKPLPRGS